MIIYNDTKINFMQVLDEDRIAEVLLDNFKRKLNKRPSQSEINSWINSLEYVYKVLNDADIPSDIGIALEYMIPGTSKRIDVLLSGSDNANISNMIIVELKQWHEVESIPDSESIVKTFIGGRLRNHTHPSYQAWSYAQLLKDFKEPLQKGSIQLYPCTYLHNYPKSNKAILLESQYDEYTSQAPVFVNGEVPALRNFIKSLLQQGAKKDIVKMLEESPICIAKSLQSSIKAMLKGNQIFTMIDDQRVVYDFALRLARLTMKEYAKKPTKQVIIIQGGPGTGKSVVAINIMAQLLQENIFARYITKTEAPRKVYAEQLRGDYKKKNIDILFTGSGTSVNTPDDALDVAVVDEAHRLTGPKHRFNKGKNQINEIIRSSKVSIFFIDEDQRVSLEDVGSIDEIKKFAKENGAHINEYELVSQFRCNGSNGYLGWIDNTLEIRETANETLDDIDYDFRVVDTATELYDLVKAHNNQDTTARLVAGYCWEWISNGKADSSVHDIVIDDFSISWNLFNSKNFASDPDSINEAGCIHTTQGLELGYIGVIIGPDMRYENGHIVTDASKRAKTDKALNGIKKMAKENPEEAYKTADRIIKNTYRTLMTRGMKGCFVYCVDEGLRDYLRSAATFRKDMQHNE